MHKDEGTIHAWLDGELPAHEAAEVEAHMAECPACSALVAEARGVIAASSRILSALDDVPGGVLPAERPTLPPALRVERGGASRRAPRAWYRRGGFAAAAAAVVMALGTWTVTRQTGDPAATRVAMEAPVPTAGPQLLDSVTLERKVGEQAAPAPLRRTAARDEAAREETAASGAASVVANAVAPEDKVTAADAPRRAAALASASGDSTQASKRDRAVLDSVAGRREARVDALVSSERARLEGEVRAQSSMPAAAPPAAGRSMAKGEARPLTDVTVAGAAAAVPMRCYTLTRSAEAQVAGVPATVQLMEMSGPLVNGRQLKIVVSSAGKDWYWYRSADGGLSLIRLSGEGVAYEVRMTGVGADAVVGTERRCPGM